MLFHWLVEDTSAHAGFQRHAVPLAGRGHQFDTPEVVRTGRFGPE
jgi:hypothetical protein